MTFWSSPSYIHWGKSEQEIPSVYVWYMDSSFDGENTRPVSLVLDLCPRQDLDFDIFVQGGWRVFTITAWHQQMSQISNFHRFYLIGSETSYYAFTAALFTKWKWHYYMADRGRGFNFVEILQCAVCWAFFLELYTHGLRCLWKQMSPKLCRWHILFHCVQYTYMQ